MNALIPLSQQPVIDEIISAILTNLDVTSRPTYRESIESFLTFCADRLETNPFQSPQTAFIAFKDHLKERYSPSTANKKLSGVREFFRYAWIHSLIGPEQYEGVRAVGNIKQSGTPWRQWLNHDQASLLLDLPDESPIGLRDRVAILLMMVLGLRRAEAASVKWDQLQQSEGIWLIVNVLGKGSQIRHVEVPEKYLPILYQWRELHPSGFILVSIDRHGNIGDEPLNLSSVNRIMEKYGVRPHDLRRTCASLALEGGASLRAIQHHLGHKSVTTTEIYLAPILELGQGASQFIDL